ncbi:MAG: nucleotidyltransferase family protein [Truepera sp.]|nr:nucleotidyltransferase family protein [Truepera sp.]
MLNGMRRDEALAILKAHRDEVKTRFGVQSLYLFGSTARDQADDVSDVDILVKFAPEACSGLFELYDLKLHLETLLGREVDVLTPDGLRWWMREDILKEAV